MPNWNGVADLWRHTPLGQVVGEFPGHPAQLLRRDGRCGS